MFSRHDRPRIRLPAVSTWPSATEVPSARACRSEPDRRWPDAVGRRPGAGAGLARAELAGTGPPVSAALDRLRAHHAAGRHGGQRLRRRGRLGRAGLLDGRRCTTHHELQDELARRYPRRPWSATCSTWSTTGWSTSAGIASGIDLALHLVAIRHGPAVAAGSPADGGLRPPQRRRAPGQRDAAAPVARQRDRAPGPGPHRRRGSPRRLPLADLARICQVQRTHPDPAVRPRHRA